jgi:hypothetical protein
MLRCVYPCGPGGSRRTRSVGRYGDCWVEVGDWSFRHWQASVAVVRLSRPGPEAMALCSGARRLRSKAGFASFGRAELGRSGARTLSASRPIAFGDHTRLPWLIHTAFRRTQTNRLGCQRNHPHQAPDRIDADRPRTFLHRVDQPSGARRVVVGTGRAVRRWGARESRDRCTERSGLSHFGACVRRGRLRGRAPLAPASTSSRPGQRPATGSAADSHTMASAHENAAQGFQR